MDDRLLIDRRLGNFFSSARLFFDTWKGTITHFFPGSEALLLSLTTFSNKLHEGSLGYRLMDSFRNYAQHHGMTSASIDTQSTRFHAVGGNHLLEHSASVSIRPTTLVDAMVGSAKVRAEAGTLNGVMDIRILVREYVDAIVSFHLEIWKTIEPKVVAAESEFEAQWSTLVATDFGGKSFGEPFLAQYGPEGVKLKEVHFRMDMIQRRRRFCGLLRAVPLLAKSFVSGNAHTRP